MSHLTHAESPLHAPEAAEALWDSIQESGDPSLALAAPARPRSTDASKSVDPELVARCKALLTDGYKGKVWSRNELARAMGCNSANVSIYVRQQDPAPPAIAFAVPPFEAKLRDFIRNLAEKRAFNGGIIETAIVRHFLKFIDNVRATNEIGFLYGAAGLGKTTALEHATTTLPNATVVTATRWSCGAHGVEYQLAAGMKLLTPPRGTRRGDAIRNRLKEMDSAVILVDNAHRLTHAAVEFLFDIHDETGTPIILTGNRRFLDRLRADDQLFSRVFQCHEVAFPADPDKPKNHHLHLAADALLKRELPSHWQELKQAARKVAREQGHLRSLTKHCRAAAEIHQIPGYAQRTMLEAFQAAHANSVHLGSSLEED